VLRVLHMDHNQLRRLDSNSFRGMRFIRRLYFSDNNITDVGRGTFGSVTRVGTVDLARNFIKKIDFQMFNQLQYVEVPNSGHVSLFLFLLLYFISKNTWYSSLLSQNIKIKICRTIIFLLFCIGVKLSGSL